jgi:hypothetical protein
MNYLKPQDLIEIERFKSYHQLGIILTQYLKWDFNVGDVLVRSKHGETELDIVSKVCPVPKKFRVIYIDELGVPWAKQLSVRGGMGTQLYCLLNYASYFNWKHDPEIFDAILLGYKYDPRAEYRRMRNEDPNYGKQTEQD